MGIGYQEHTTGSFVDALMDEQVGLVVDVRLNAISRKKGFSKRALTDLLERNGLEYLHIPILGNPKGNRDGFWKPGTRLADDAHAYYRRLLESPTALAALAMLADMAESETVALLCFEDNEEMCHRHLILEALRGASSDFSVPMS